MTIAILFVAAVLGHSSPGVYCDADTNHPPGFVVPEGQIVEGWTLYATGEIHLHPTICAGLDAPLGTSAFARSFNVLAHEAWHATGVRDEGCAELFARMAPFDLLPRFWRATWQVALKVAKGVADYTLIKPAPYQTYDSLACLPAIITFYERSGS